MPRPNDDARPDPDELLRLTRTDSSGRGRLKVYLGMAAGVGKSVRMLDDAHAMRSAGIDIVAGLIETHGRAGTAARIGDLEVVPRRQTSYRNVTIEEMDTAAIIARRPDVVVIDELPHSNAPVLKNEKRWQDVEEILDGGISVMTALNVQHLEGVQDIVRSATGIDIRERVPDRIVREADSVVLVDLPVVELQERLREGKIYQPDQAAHGPLLRTGSLGRSVRRRSPLGRRSSLRARDRAATRPARFAPGRPHEYPLVRDLRQTPPRSSGKHHRRAAS